MRLRKTDALLLALAGMGMGDMMPLSAPTRRNIISDGHTALGNNKDAKVLRWRSKERRAKKARKINWK